MKISNLMPWDTPVYEMSEVDKAIFKIFATTEGHILWTYLQKNIVQSPPVDGESLEKHNGKVCLALHLRRMADRHYNTVNTNQEKEL